MDLTQHDFRAHLLDLLDKTGATALVGGRAVFEEGFRQIQAGLLQVGTDILVAETQGVALSDAVFDLERFPHLTRAHGLTRDFLDVEVPEEVVPWARRAVALEPCEEVGHLRRVLVAAAHDRRNPVWAGIARFVLFEVLCVNQRVLLRVERTRLEPLDAHPHAIEVLAEREVDAVLALPQEVLAEAEDPLLVFVACAFGSLEGYVDELRDALRHTTDEFRERLELRHQLLELMEGLPPADVLLLRNQAAFDGEERTVLDLRRFHPLILGSMEENALHQRSRRAPEKMRKRPKKERKVVTLGEIIVQVIDQMEGDE